MPLSGPELSPVYSALYDAYKAHELSRVVNFCMDLDFDNVTPAHDSFEDQLWSFLRYVNRKDRIPELIACAYRGNPSNSGLLRLYAKFHQPEEVRRQVVLAGCPDDSEIVYRLHVHLQASGIDAWRPDDNLEQGAYRWQLEVKKRISEALCVVVVLSPAAYTWEPLYDQIALAKARSLRIVPVVVAGQDADDAVPLELMRSKRVDARSDFDSAVSTALLPLLRSHLRTSAITLAPPSLNENAQKLDIEWIPVREGSFRMGSDLSQDEWAEDNEQPQTELHLPTFWIAKYPITNAQYNHFVSSIEYKLPKHWQNDAVPSNMENHPVVFVSWFDADAFCQWAGLSLPTEAQWEKAARGRDGRIWPWGNEPPTAQRCNYKHAEMETTAVDLYPSGASPYGVMDMAGNVWEWTSSKGRPYPYEPADGREQPQGIEDRIVRGGSSVHFDGGIRCARRSLMKWGGRYGNVGFRVALSLSSSR